MQPIILPLATLALMGAADQPATPPPADEQVAFPEFTSFAPPGKRCPDGALPTNEQQARQPRFEREPATPGQGQIIYAVDRRIEGCSVILVKSGPNAIRNMLRPSDRPLPASPPQQGK
jgi:hypothetical protein